MPHYGICEYCGVSGVMTKEHVLPHSVGGTLTISVCRDCNGRRGNSGTYPGFLRWLNKHQSVFREAVRTSTQPLKTDRWLLSYGLKRYRVRLNL